MEKLNGNFWRNWDAVQNYLKNSGSGREEQACGLLKTPLMCPSPHSNWGFIPSKQGDGSSSLPLLTQT